MVSPKSQCIMTLCITSNSTVVTVWRSGRKIRWEEILTLPIDSHLFYFIFLLLQSRNWMVFGYSRHYEQHSQLLSIKTIRRQRSDFCQTNTKKIKTENRRGTYHSLPSHARGYIFSYGTKERQNGREQEQDTQYLINNWLQNQLISTKKTKDSTYSPLRLNIMMLIYPFGISQISQHHFAHLLGSFSNPNLEDFNVTMLVKGMEGSDSGMQT